MVHGAPQDAKQEGESRDLVSRLGCDLEFCFKLQNRKTKVGHSTAELCQKRKLCKRPNWKILPLETKVNMFHPVLTERFWINWKLPVGAKHNKCCLYSSLITDFAVSPQFGWSVKFLSSFPPAVGFQRLLQSAFWPTSGMTTSFLGWRVGMETGFHADVGRNADWSNL